MPVATSQSRGSRASIPWFICTATDGRYDAPMKARHVVLVCSLLSATAVLADGDRDARVREIVLNSRKIGAHGLGYNSESLAELGRSLKSDDIPTLIALLKDKEVRVGAEFGLASQCGEAIDPVKTAASEKRTSFLDSIDVMEFISDYEACPAADRERAKAVRIELDEMREEQYRKTAERLAKEKAEDQRIQENGIKMLDPAAASKLTLEERKEVFERSVKAAGLENPKTPEQKAMVERMYRTMVLGESEGKKKQN